MKSTLYLVVQSFAENKGSFSGFTENLARYAHKKKYKVKILCAKKENQKKSEKLSYAEVHRFSFVKIPVFRMLFDAYFLAKKVKKFLKENPPKEEDVFVANGEAALGILDKDFIHRGGDQPAFTFWKNMEIAKAHVSIFSRMARLLHLIVQYFMEKKYMKHNSALIYSSKKARDNFVSYYGGEKKPYFTPHSGVDFSSLKKAKKLDMPGKNMLFVSAKNEEIRKGTIYLEKALPKLFERYNNLNLIHVGEKRNWQVQEKYKKRINTIGRVPWEKMKQYYKTADVLICSSLSEAFPIVIFEAMASGCPVVTSDLDGIEQYIKHKEQGYVFKRGSSQEIVNGVSYMIDNPKKAKEMAKKAQDKIKLLDNKNYCKQVFDFIINVKKGDAKTRNLLKS